MTLLSLLVLLTIVHYQTIYSMVAIWQRSETFMHGFLILPLSLFLVWRQRENLLTLRPEPSALFLTLLLPGSVVWFLGDLVDVQLVKQTMVVTAFIVLVVGVLGVHVGKRLMFPLLFLYFMVPFGEFFVPILQDVTAYFTVKMLLLTGIPVFWEGRYFEIPSGSFEVAKACSGIRYLIASVVLGLLFAQLNYTSLKKKVMFVFISFIVPVVANGFRAYGIVLIAHYSDHQLAVGVDHLIYGWLFFGAVIFVLFYFGAKYRDSDSKPVLRQHAPEDANQDLAGLRVVSVVSVASVLIFLGPGLAQLSMNQSVFLLKSWGQTSIDGWDNVTEPLLQVAPSYTGKAIILHSEYVKLGVGRVSSYIVQYGQDKGGGELINSTNQHFDNDKWLLQESRRKTLDSGYEVNEFVIQDGTNKYLVWQFYLVGQNVVASDSKAKLMQAYSMLMRDSSANASVILVSNVGDGFNQAITGFKTYITELLLPQIRRQIGKQ